MSNVVKAEPKNEIVVYQPNETMRLDVRLANDTVWLTQGQIAELFGTKRPAITKHLANIYKSGELDEESTCSILEHMGQAGVQLYKTKSYNLDAILSVGYRVNSYKATCFRRWASTVLREFLLHGLAVNQRMIAMEERIDRRLSKHDADIIELRKDVDYFISSSLPPKEKVFVEGKMLDAQAELTRIVDNTVWHIGASLKDAGSALFAMMKMELDPSVILGLLP